MEDLGSALSSIPSMLVQHWVFFVVSFVLGLIGHVFKTQVWTYERAQESRVMHWIRAFLPLHAPLAGFLLGVVVTLVMGDDAPAGPGVAGKGYVVIYYMGAGAVSAWVVNAWKFFMASRGVSDPYTAPVTLPPSRGDA
jgi:hypothetical protein